MKRSYPWLALGLGLLLSLILMRFSANGMEGRFQLPLLTSLLIAEFGFLVTAIAAGIGIRDLLKKGREYATILLLLGNILLAVNFARMGFALWPGTIGG